MDGYDVLMVLQSIELAMRVIGIFLCWVWVPERMTMLPSAAVSFSIQGSAKTQVNLDIRTACQNVSVHKARPGGCAQL